MSFLQLSAAILAFFFTRFLNIKKCRRFKQNFGREVTLKYLICFWKDIYLFIYLLVIILFYLVYFLLFILPFFFYFFVFFYLLLLFECYNFFKSNLGPPLV